MLEKVRHTLLENQLPQPPAHWLLGLSGGADSVALLLALQKLGYRITAVHCNFHLRGDESDRDEHFVRQLCLTKGIDLKVTHFDTVEVARSQGISIEMAARQLRYDLFHRLLEEYGCTGIAVAHHRDDNVETWLLNLVRGAGIHGLTGMRVKNGNIIRPLLSVSRQEIEKFLQQEGQDFVTDSSNTDTIYKRNLIRHELLPLMKQLNPSVVETLLATARRLEEAELLYKRSVHELTALIVTPLADGIDIDLEKLDQAPAPSTLLYEWLVPYGFTPESCRNIFHHRHSPTGSLFDSPTALAVIHRGQLQVRHRPILFEDIPLDTETLLPDRTSLNIQYLSREHLLEIPRSANIACLDADQICGSLTCRSIVPGDRFRPLGMKGSRLVSDYLTDRHRSLIDKRKAKVVCDEKGILWLVGERLDHRACITETTRRIIQISVVSSSPTAL